MNTDLHTWEIKKGKNVVALSYSYASACEIAYKCDNAGRLTDVETGFNTGYTIAPLRTATANECFAKMAQAYMESKGKSTDYECLVRLGHWIDKGFDPYIDSYDVIWCADFIVGNCSIDDFGLYTYEDYKDMNCAGFKDLEQYGIDMNREE